MTNLNQAFANNAAINVDRFDDNIVIPTLLENVTGEFQKGIVKAYTNAPEIDLSIYDKIILANSGGKDSLVCMLRLIEMGADLSQIELWHHDVDGQEGSSLMDWAFMRDYNIQLAEHFGVPIYFSWLQGGFEGEMLKENSFSQPHIIETPEGLKALARVTKITKRVKPSTRRRFPQKSASLSTRWCSGALKVDVGRRQIANQTRFHHSNVLFVTGERREESPKRATYKQLEYHTTDARNGRLGRRVDSWRPVLNWSEEKVWAMIERHGLVAPLPYRLGWSRSSCMACIFNSPVIWATIAHYFPDKVAKIDAYEKEFGVSISRDKRTVLEVVKGIKPIEISDPTLLRQAVSSNYFLPVTLASNEQWKLPSGAFSSEVSGAI